MEYLFIGGPIDGQRRNTKGQDFYDIAIYEPLVIGLSISDNLNFERHSYYLDHIQVFGTVISFYRSQDLSCLTAIQQLLERYPKYEPAL